MKYALIVLFTAAIVTVASYFIAALIGMMELMLALPGAFACGLIIAFRQYDEDRSK